MNPRHSVGILCVAITGSLLTGGSGLSAQGGVVSACAHETTGAIRVVAAGSQCRPQESPLQWNVAGEPGEQTVVALGTSGTSNSGPKSVTIPVLGTVEVRCDAGVPKVTMDFAGNIQGSQR